MLQKLEDRLEELYKKKVSYKLPEKFKKYFLSYMPWVMLASGFFSALAAESFYRSATQSNKFIDYVNSINATYGAAPTNNNITISLWVAVVVFACLSILSFAAYMPLKAHKMLGWKFLFWINLVNVIYALYDVFASFNIIGFVISIALQAVSLYVLFQVKGLYTATKK